MSGGHFDYAQHRINDITEKIIKAIESNTEYKDETIDEFIKGLEYLNIAKIYAQRIDWLLSGDDAEDSFHERLKEDLYEYGRVLNEK